MKQRSELLSMAVYAVIGGMYLAGAMSTTSFASGVALCAALGLVGIWQDTTP